MTLLQKIDNIEAAIFDYEIKNVMNNIVSVFTEIIETGSVNANEPDMINKLNTLMSDCLAAMNDKDYLLLADYLEYFLKPMMGDNIYAGLSS